jgi:hypothetical protein
MTRQTLAEYVLAKFDGKLMLADPLALLNAMSEYFEQLQSEGARHHHLTPFSIGSVKCTRCGQVFPRSNTADYAPPPAPIGGDPETVGERIIRGLEEALRGDLAHGGTAIFKTNADGSVERVSPEDFYKPPPSPQQGEPDEMVERLLDAREHIEESHAVLDQAISRLKEKPETIVDDEMVNRALAAYIEDRRDQFEAGVRVHDPRRSMVCALGAALSTQEEGA